MAEGCAARGPRYDLTPRDARLLITVMQKATARRRQGLACAASHALVASVNIVSKLPSVVISVMAWPNLSARAVQGDFFEKATNISAVSSAWSSTSTSSFTPALAASARPG